MNKKIKLVILILMSLSVYGIYNRTKDTTYTIMNIGDHLSTGINSYGIKDYGYVDYLKEELEQEKQEVIINNKYSSKSETIENLLLTIKETPTIKKELSSSNLLLLTIGYNDLLFKESLEENLTESKEKKIIKEIIENYEELLKEINKYYHKKIVVIGNYTRNTSIYQKQGIKEINKYLENNKDIIFIDTESLTKEEKNFSNPMSYYPNRYGYYVISKKIIRKTLENQENI